MQRLDSTVSICGSKRAKERKRGKRKCFSVLVRYARLGLFQAHLAACRCKNELEIVLLIIMMEYKAHDAFHRMQQQHSPKWCASRRPSSRNVCRRSILTGELQSMPHCQHAWLWLGLATLICIFVALTLLKCHAEPATLCLSLNQ